MRDKVVLPSHMCSGNDDAVWPVAPAGRADGGVQDGRNHLVGHGLRAEVAYRPLAVDGIEKGHMYVYHGRIPPPTFTRSKHRHWVKRIRRVTGFDTREAALSSATPTFLPLHM